ncbi:hypothetical protein PHLGIDRAFT_131333 [Phlebiopsis gigantea 11061_1 CR5-6]|uniref:Uncharacterized protein n=1 Tax=Phlebiopsis gigantea (strain 11061_1 CR5-6) TaxID=745531 RepID=A0A0C3S192_PHLG1|nr:hypothetical protein PHLGIDRAFT_131333 [Phlebiopsis gigantea 11061_1 CR5-6]
MSTGNSSSAGASVGQKIKGAFQTVHGLGESIRGNAMDFVDSATGTAQTGHSATERGTRETAVGVANMESRAPAPATTTTGTSTRTAATPAAGAATTTYGRTGGDAPLPAAPGSSTAI